jgi:glycosyltransferase involved in cell wall biosynthesis
MNNLVKLSIIIPFYNVEKYIAECLDSIYTQDIPESEYEVICVNDCSPDSSREIVLEYQKKHDNLILLEHETNKMLGATRNTGLKVASGNYVTFIDSDDYIKSNVFNKLLSIIETNNLEILHFNMLRVTDNGNESEYFYFPVETEIISGIDYLKNETVPYWKRLVTACGKLYKNDFLTNNGLFFPEGVYFEDNVHTLNSLLHCQRFKYITDRIYMYRLNENSIMNTNILGGKKLADKVRVEVECISLLINWYDKDIMKLLIPMYTYPLITRKKAILYLSYPELKQFYERLKKISKDKFRSNLKFKDYFLYVYPIPIYTVNFLLMQVLRIIRDEKRKLYN